MLRCNHITSKSGPCHIQHCQCG